MLQLWHQPASAAEVAAREQLVRMARAAEITGLPLVVKTLQVHCAGVCAYVDRRITIACLEAGNDRIGMLPTRAR